MDKVLPKVCCGRAAWTNLIASHRTDEHVEHQQYVGLKWNGIGGETAVDYLYAVHVLGEIIKKISCSK